MELIRLATPEEVEKLKDDCDLTMMSSMYALGEGERACYAVIRTCTELDPIIFPPDFPDTRKYLFLWGMQNAIKVTGVQEIYFNVAADDTKWRAALEKDGAQPVSKQPEIRYKKVLI